ncbi:hypothetical protein RND71_003950 [Anisodus tanguticus]|uniref:Uncharacterized protein n=1 Tax=Anisodus tanguticus TaxID=243964 RepID=A0AAE1SVJ4_9SOLA|nr:hypothetical protein RND71_003950 [Anisodus tanguticus]
MRRAWARRRRGIFGRFLKKDEHLVTFRSSVAKTQIYFLLLRKVDKGFCKDYKVIRREDLTTRNKLLVMYLEIRMEKKKSVVDDRLRIKWGSLTMTSGKEMGERLMAKRAWGVVGMPPVCGTGRPVAFEM